jgi:hypothetical protein
MTGRQEYDRMKDRQRILDEYMIDFNSACVVEGEARLPLTATSPSHTQTLVLA